MLAWMVYVVVVTLFLGGAAFAAERSAQGRRAPTRWLWGASIIASLVLPTVMSSVSIQIPNVSSMIGPMAAPQPFPLRQMTAAAVQPSAWLETTIGPLALTPNVDTLLARAWAGASALIFLILLINGAVLFRRKRAWERQLIAGTSVFVSEDTGPAVVGLLRPCIVLPRWITQAPNETQTLVLAHEASHIDAKDAQLLAIAILLIVTMPWNLPLWWQLRRLRYAIEVDCDARVLKGGHDMSRYGEALILVGERQSSRVAVVAAMSESKSFLEQRIRKMLWKPRKYAWASATAMACLGFVLAAGAAEVSPPNTAPAAGDVHVSAFPMKRYRNAEWNFALDVPARWNAFPAVPANSPYEVIRFASDENGTHLLIIFRAPYDPNVSPETNSDRVQQNLAKAGFTNFAGGETRIGGHSVRTLDFDLHRPDGKTWYCRQFFFIDGTLTYTLGFGTTDPKAMFGLYDAMAKSFVFQGPGAAPASNPVIPAPAGGFGLAAPASTGKKPVSVTFRLVDDAADASVRAGDERAAGSDGKDFWLKPGAQVTGAMFASARAVDNPEGRSGVEFTLTPEGKARLAALTRDNIGRRLALVVDGKVLWAPMIQAEISGGAGQISGQFSRDQAETLARDITTGAAGS